MTEALIDPLAIGSQLAAEFRRDAAERDLAAATCLIDKAAEALELA
jgi:hypothetical protein